MESPSKTKRILFGAIAGLGLFAGAAGVASAMTGQSGTPTSAQERTADAPEKGDTPDATFKSSITVPDNGPEKDDATEAAELAKVAKISDADARAAATAAVPGTVVKSELENEDGNVVYEVEIKGADGKVTEVIVDAGNGKVLHQELEDDDEDCDKGKDGKEAETGTEAVTDTSAPATSAGN